MRQSSGDPRRSSEGAALQAALLLFLASSPALFAAEPSSPDAGDGAGRVTLERIMAHPDWLGRAPERPYWADDGDSVYYFRPEPSSDGFDPRDFELWEASLDGKELRKVEPEQLPETDVANGVFDRERRRKVFERAGDVYLKDLSTGAVRQLARTAGEERAPFFLADGRIGWVRDRQVFARDLATGLEEQLFDLRAEQDPLEKREKERGEADYLRRQQDRLFDWIRDEERRRDETVRRERDRQRRDPARIDPPIFLGDELEIEGVHPSPDGRRVIVVTTAKRPKPPAREKMPQYVTTTGRVETRDVRPKVGEQRAPAKLWLVDRTTGAAHPLDLQQLPDITVDPLAELRQAAEERARARKALQRPAQGPAATEPEGGEEGENGEARDGEKPAAPKKPRARDVGVGQVAWTPGGERVVLDVYSLDNKDRWIATLGPDGGALVSLHHQHDPAWIGWDFRALGWLRDEEQVYFLSEESGWSQLYVIDATSADGAKPRRLTRGDFVVESPTVSPDGRFLYYSGNASHPGNYEVYRVPVDGGEAEQVSALGGVNEYVLSADGERILLLHSTSTRPPEVWWQDASPGAAAVQISRTVSDEFAALPWAVPEVVEVPSRHAGRPIYARLYLPTGEAGLDAEGRRPAVMFIHGAGYLQNAHLGWSSYFREFMFHTLLVQRGYVVLDMDYRASAGYGRDWRTAIYRHMGGPEVEDLADGVRFLVERHRVDPQRVGAYGGSYGGFLTLMAMFTRPELFGAGAALRPVTDWAHYNHPYTANILNTPELDPEAYERSSPIELAEGLSKPLLICTGMLDDNVFFQDSVRLAQRLIELEKKDWEVAMYPVEPHGFREPASWLDEYRRILDLFEQHLKP